MRYYGVMSLVFTMFLAACGENESSSPSKAGTAGGDTNLETTLETEVTVGITPSSISLYGGEKADFTAAVHGNDDRSVTWTATGGSVDADGLYQAPTKPGEYRVVATSNADPSSHAVALVKVETKPAVVTLSVSPQSATLVTGESITFAPTFHGIESSDVAWLIEEGSVGGTIASDGHYEAPDDPGVYHVVVESVEDASLRAAAVVTVIPDFSVTLGVSTQDVLFGKAIELAAGVSEGPFDELHIFVEESQGGVVDGDLYTAPHEAGTYHLVAESVVNPNRRAVVPIYVCGMFDHILAFATTGTDATVGTDDDQVEWQLRFSYAPGNLIFDTFYAAFEPGGTTHGWLEWPADGVNAVMMYETSDVLRGISDSAIDRYFSVHYGKSIRAQGYAEHATAGADGVYGTEDDLLNQWVRNVYNEGGDLVRVNHYDSPGHDGVWGTDDDVLAGYEEFEYDESGHLIAIIKRDEDDTVRQSQLFVNDDNGLPVSRTIKDRRGRTRDIFEYEYDSEYRIASRIHRAHTGNGQAQPHRDTRRGFTYAEGARLPGLITEWVTGEDQSLGTDDDESASYVTWKNICPW